MMHPIHVLFTKYVPTNQNLNFFRYVRSIARRGLGPKIVEGKVETITEYDNAEQIQSYKDFVKSVRKSKLGDELEIEKNFLHDDYHGDVFEKIGMYSDVHKSEEKELKSHIKKKIIGRKYFKLERETNLLTHAAKQQIRFLHYSNPLEWNYKALAECFPTTETGLKKLLKSNFVLTCPERIKVHDDDVAKKWQMLKSGEFTDYEIAPLTQKLYKEGKLVDDYFSGNPNLPAAKPPTKKIIELEKPEEFGEFSAIVKTYHDYEKQKLLGNKESSEKQITLQGANTIRNSKKNNVKKLRKITFDADDSDNEDDADPEVFVSRRRSRKVKDDEISFSNFKELLKEESEAQLKSKSKYEKEYGNFMVEQISKTYKNSSKQPPESQSCFLKIPKYEKENVDAMYEKGKQIKNVYKYDEKLGYQYPVGKNIKGKINFVSKKHKNEKFHKVGQCVYDENGEFLYKIPT